MPGGCGYWHMLRFTRLTLCPLGNFSCVLSSADFFFKIDFFKKFFQEYHLKVKQIRSRSGLTLCHAWSGSNLFAKVLSRRHVYAQLSNGAENLIVFIWDFIYILTSILSVCKQHWMVRMREWWDCEDVKASLSIGCQCDKNHNTMCWRVYLLTLYTLMDSSFSFDKLGMVHCLNRGYNFLIKIVFLSLKLVLP